MLGNGSETLCGNRDRTSSVVFKKFMLVPMCSILEKELFEFFLSLFRFSSKTATALCWGTVVKQFALIKTDRALVVFTKFMLVPMCSILAKELFNFSKAFRCTSKTATALCWGTVAKHIAVKEIDRALVVFKKFMLVPMCSILEKELFEFFLSLFRFTSKTATTLCWGTVAKQFEVIETDRALVVFKKFMLVSMCSMEKELFEFFQSF